MKFSDALPELRYNNCIDYDNKYRVMLSKQQWLLLLNTTGYQTMGAKPTAWIVVCMGNFTDVVQLVSWLELGNKWKVIYG